MRKGFTLIELLAVIVILAIILMIATPMVMNVINSAKEKAAHSSAVMFVKQVQTQLMMADYIPGQALVISASDATPANELNITSVNVTEDPYDAETSIKVVANDIDGTIAYQGYIFTITDGVVSENSTGTYTVE